MFFLAENIFSRKIYVALPPFLRDLVECKTTQNRLKLGNCPLKSSVWMRPGLVKHIIFVISKIVYFVFCRDWIDLKMTEILTGFEAPDL